MNIWHLTPDAPRLPQCVSAGEGVTLDVGTWPSEPDQKVRIEFSIGQSDKQGEVRCTDAQWQRNEGANSYWRATIGPFGQADQVRYRVRGSSRDGECDGGCFGFRVGVKVFLALLWHQHQPLYKNLSLRTPEGSYLEPWVRLHAIRDYYSMAAILLQHPDIHLTINLTPSLLWQLEDYVTGRATDRALELTLRPAEALSADERRELLGSFFDADWHNQIFPHPGYKRLFAKRVERHRFTAQDFRDLQMWFNLAWFAREFRQGEARLVTGETVSVRRFVEQDSGFGAADIPAMVEEQFKILRAIVPVHRELQDRGQIEVSTTPFFHPILPILIDSDRATIDRPGAKHPPRFSYPDDADEQVRRAAEDYQRRFGRCPRGMWPAEGAVGQCVLPFFARHGVQWIATDRGVLAKSGRWGYPADDPEVLCQPYRAQEGSDAVTVFFRDPRLSDHIGFHHHDLADCEGVARTFLVELKERFASRFSGQSDRVLTVVLDGENAWGAYREDGRPFLHAFYQLLEGDPQIQTVTLSEFLEGNPDRGVSPHRVEGLRQVHDLFTGSWIDESGSAPGVDLGTWIGEEEENKAWGLLGGVREYLRLRRLTPSKEPAAFQSLYAAEGSDWFWWFGRDQESGSDDRFDDLFRLHLRNVYARLGETPPKQLDRHIVPHPVRWTFTQPVRRIQFRDELVIQTNCPGILSWRFDDGLEQSSPVFRVRGVLAGVGRFRLTLTSIPGGTREVRFRFRCSHPGCQKSGVCCRDEWETVTVEE